MKKRKIQNSKRPDPTPMFVTWNENDGGRSKALAFATSASALSTVENVIQRTSAATAFRDSVSDSYVRNNTTRRDYEYFRPEESLPQTYYEDIKAGAKAYKNGIVRNVIDIMGDFACKGIELIHPNPKIQKFFRDWAKQVGFYDRSERFLNLFYRLGNVFTLRQTAKITLGDAQDLSRTQATPDIDVERPPKPEKREIPWKYTFINPLTIEVLGDELAIFAGKLVYGIKVKDSLVKRIKMPRSEIDKSLVGVLPGDVLSLIKKGAKVLPLDPAKMEAYFYKKDDWQAFAEPFTSAIYEDVLILKKLKLSDLMALDGAISHIRLWRLGSLEHRILPTDAGIARLAEVLMNNLAGGTMDLIWGPELDLKETSTDSHHFLGHEKYEPTLNSIYAGLGIPPTLTGSATASGFTNNYISLKTLTERLSYGRQTLVEFWTKEIRLVQKAMGFRLPAQIRFDRMSLSDEAAEKKLLLELVDRDIISVETVIERFGEIPELEKARVRKEYKERSKGRMPEKASPYHNAEHIDDLEKIALQTGVVTPSEVGVDLKPKKPGEKVGLEYKTTVAPPGGDKNVTRKFKPTGKSGQGRPKNSKDKQKRMQKRVIPRTAASLMTAYAWAKKTQNSISKIVTPVYLEAQGKKDVRALSDDEVNSLEEFKHALLCSFDLENEVNDKIIVEKLANTLDVPQPCQALYSKMVEKYVTKFSAEPPMEEQRQMKAMVYALYKGKFDETDSGN
jgi:hypothetical protein